ncbi:hypothetical protein J6590_077895 [Homalodisca vitripennis]|nr:hypothetical protein J6590_077895 [Homalodisca vitripennis]
MALSPALSGDNKFLEVRLMLPTRKVEVTGALWPETNTGFDFVISAKARSRRSCSSLPRDVGLFPDALNLSLAVNGQVSKLSQDTKLDVFLVNLLASQ